MSNQVVDCAVIEQQKENIIPLPGGRPASKLVANFNSASKSHNDFKEQQKKQRDQFEVKIQQFDELDDPLQVYIDYIKWTHDNFPQGSNTESGLLSLLERCTSCFRDILYYKNDPRYLKVWMEYANYSDAPREIFIYLSKKEIGNQLALYYEEFARFLEVTGKLNDARLIYEMGVEVNARPLTRLMRSFHQFEERMSTRDTQEVSPSSIRNALSVKKGDSISMGDGYNDTKKSRKKQKLQVYNDEGLNDGMQSLRDVLLDTSGLKELGSIKTRIKENVLSAKPWQGEIIKQKTEASRPESRFEVFRDEEQIEKNEIMHDKEDNLHYTIIRQPGKNVEKVSVNMDLVYPSPDEEYCFEEILAMTRRFSKINVNNQPSLPIVTNIDAQKYENNDDIFESRNENNNYEERTKPYTKDEIVKIPLNDENVDHSLPHRDDSIEHTFTLPLKSDSNLSPERHRPNSPTMTMFSRLATNEVYNMFNDAADNLTTDDELDNKSEQENTTNYDEFVTETIQVPKDIPQGLSHSRPPSTPPTDHYDSDHQAEEVQSSPFIERPSSKSLITNDPKIFNPSDIEMKSSLLNSLTTPLASYKGFFDYRHTKVNKMREFQKITKNKSILKGTNSSIINYCGDGIYSIRYELGTGSYGAVYLIETELGEFKALKIESPSSQWEFYILNQIQERLSLKPHIRMKIIRAESLSYFRDESYLVLNYLSQGTLLDVVNYYSDQNLTVDEILCVFISIDLIKVVESLHEVGIIHGDLKADNCMIRFEDNELDHESYQKVEPHNSKTNRWQSKGITLIDFGRAIDLNLFNDSENVQFVSDWETDGQDCPPMRRGDSWSYDADYYGIAAIIHTLLFGEYIEVKSTENGRYKLVNNFKRYWQVDLWMPLFDLLLNPYFGDDKSGLKEPKTNELKLHRNNLEDWLVKHSASRNLKQIIKNIEDDLNSKNRKLIRSLK